MSTAAIERPLDGIIEQLQEAARDELAYERLEALASLVQSLSNGDELVVHVYRRRKVA